MVQRITGIKSSAATNSVSVELRVLSFCLVEVLQSMPFPSDMQPPEWPRILGCVACEPSTHHLGTGTESALRVNDRLGEPRRYRMRRVSFFQSSWSGPLTRVVRNATAVAMSGLARLVRNRHLATKL